MKFICILRITALLMIGFIIAGEKAEAQSFGLGVAPSADSIAVSNSLTYNITVTNLTGDLVANVVVSNVLPASVVFVSAVPSQGDYQVFSNVIVFNLFSVGQAQIVPMTLTVQPTAAGLFTNLVSVLSTNLLIAPTFTNVVTEVTNPVPLEADLGVARTGSAQATNIANDFITYGVTATNLGPNDATGVFLTNILPAGVIFKNVSPKLTYVSANTNLIFNLGTLPALGFTNLQLTVQPTNAGVLNFSASITAPGINDPNLTNNFASTNIYVINYLPGQLIASLTSTQTYNPQNGLVEQTVRLSNTGTNAVPAARLVVTGLTKQQLFNSSGTNNGNPFAVYAATLGTNQSVSLLLQFFAPNIFPLTNSQLQALAVPVPNLTPPVSTSTSTSLNISRIFPLTTGNVLLEFPTTPGRAYTVVYSDNVLFSNAMIAPPAIVAPANQLQWIDYGPPTTISAPTNSGSRFYRVFLNP
jgi:uncharacterized repeat protein (TIGR01451 family)